jgi:cytochrome c551/c552
MKSVSILLAAVAVLATNGSAFAGTGEDLIASNKCSKCHTATTTKKAPSFASVAAKYKGDAAAQAKIADMLKTGGNDHDKVAASDADLKAIAATVLSSK